MFSLFFCLIFHVSCVNIKGSSFPLPYFRLTVRYWTNSIIGKRFLFFFLSLTKDNWIFNPIMEGENIKDIIGERLLKKAKWETIKQNNWNPEVGDKMEGTLLSVTKSEGNFIINIYGILTNENKKVKVFGCTHLDELMDEVEIGDYIRITYNGLKKTNNGYNMKLFNLERRIKDEE